MSKTEAEYSELESLMKQAAVPDPSEALKKRVTEAAQKAWSEDRGDVPARILLVRLAASIAAAVILIALAEFYSSHVASQGRPAVARTTTPESIEPMAPLESSHPMVARHSITRIRVRSQIDAPTVREHMERIRRVLDESQRSGASRSVEGRSDRTPIEPDSGSYS